MIANRMMSLSGIEQGALNMNSVFFSRELNYRAIRSRSDARQKNPLEGVCAFAWAKVYLSKKVWGVTAFYSPEFN